MRDWLSFTTERTADKSLCLLVGVAGRNLAGRGGALRASHQRRSPIKSHIHAAAFPYRPVQRGELPFSGMVAESSPYPRPTLSCT